MKWFIAAGKERCPVPECNECAVERGGASMFMRRGEALVVRFLPENQNWQAICFEYVEDAARSGKMIRIRNHNTRLMLGALLVAAMFGYVRFELESSATAEAAARLPAGAAVLRN